jgi:type VI secretion system protein ImpM
VSAGPSGAVPGWYGKLPTLGDFVSRRLPTDFIRIWDAWLQDVLEASRASLGPAWLDCYLTTPIWRFVILPEVIGPSAWAGVLMPSVDRVGRHFPLTVAVALPSYASVAYAVFEGTDWFGGVEEAALSALDPTRGPDDLDRSLADSAFVPPRGGNVEDAGELPRALPSIESFGLVAQAEALRAWSVQARWRGLWWTRGRVNADPLMLTCAGLPGAEEFGWLLESRAVMDTRRRF